MQLPIAVESSDGRQIKTFSLLIDPISYSAPAINTAPLAQKPMPITPKVETEKTIKQPLAHPEPVRTPTPKPVNTAKKAFVRGDINMLMAGMHTELYDNSGHKQHF